MSEPTEVVSQKVKEAVYVVKELGIMTVLCGSLLYVVVWKLDKIEERLGAKVDKVIFNTRAIMQHLKIPVVLRDEK